MWRKASAGISDALVHITKPTQLILILVEKKTIVELRDALVHKALAGSLEGSVFLLSPLAYARTVMRIFQKL